MNVSCLCPYKEPQITGQEATPAPPVEINGELEYEIEQILDSQLQYLVKWQGYTEEHNTWELPTNLANAQDATVNSLKTHTHQQCDASVTPDASHFGPTRNKRGTLSLYL